MNIYVASSWRNDYQQEVVKQLRWQGHRVYDFKHPSFDTSFGSRGSDNGFAWSEVDPNWEHWSHRQYLEALEHPRSQNGFEADFDAMIRSDACVLVLPAGRSAHLEAGYFCGVEDKALFILLGENEVVPELMYKMADGIGTNLEEVIGMVNQHGITRFNEVH